jgi:hypothetical protein
LSTPQSDRASHASIPGQRRPGCSEPRESLCPLPLCDERAVGARWACPPALGAVVARWRIPSETSREPGGRVLVAPSDRPADEYVRGSGIVRRTGGGGALCRRSARPPWATQGGNAIVRTGRVGYALVADSEPRSQAHSPGRCIGKLLGRQTPSSSRRDGLAVVDGGSDGNRGGGGSGTRRELCARIRSASSSGMSLTLRRRVELPAAARCRESCQRVWA